MSTYLLVMTPEPVADENYGEAFVNLIGCNPAYEGIVWNGITTFFKVQVGTFWASLIQMNDDHVRDDAMLTVVWAADPLNNMVDREHNLYRQLRPELVKYVDEWAADLGSKRGDGHYYDGHVCWVLENADTDILNKDFASETRKRFRAI